jgi:hypothetical protein
MGKKHTRLKIATPIKTKLLVSKKLAHSEQIRRWKLPCVDRWTSNVMQAEDVSEQL